MYLCIYTRVNCERHRNNKELYYNSDDYHSENLEYCWKMNHDHIVIVTQFRCSRDGAELPPIRQFAGNNWGTVGTSLIYRPTSED